MTIPQNVADALDTILSATYAASYERTAHNTIRAHLMRQEMEIERLNGLRERNRAICKKLKREVEWMRERLAERDISLSTEIQIRSESESRLAAANALLLECQQTVMSLHPATYERIQSHLQGAGHE